MVKLIRELPITLQRIIEDEIKYNFPRSYFFTGKRMKQHFLNISHFYPIEVTHFEEMAIGYKVFYRRTDNGQTATKHPLRFEATHRIQEG